MEEIRSRLCQDMEGVKTRMVKRMREEKEQRKRERTSKERDLKGDSRCSRSSAKSPNFPVPIPMLFLLAPKLHKRVDKKGEEEEKRGETNCLHTLCARQRIGPGLIFPPFYFSLFLSFFSFSIPNSGNRVPSLNSPSFDFIPIALLLCPILVFVPAENQNIGISKHARLDLTDDGSPTVSQSHPDMD